MEEIFFKSVDFLTDHVKIKSKMREGILFLALFAFIACSNSSSEVIDEKEQPKPEQQVDGTLIADGIV